MQIDYPGLDQIYLQNYVDKIICHLIIDKVNQYTQRWVYGKQ